MKRLSCLLIVLAMLTSTVSAQIEITSQPSKRAMPIVSAKVQAVIVVDDADAQVVATAAECMANDVEAITGKRLTIASTVPSDGAAILAGTVGQSPLIDQLVADGRCIGGGRQVGGILHTDGAQADERREAGTGCNWWYTTWHSLRTARVVAPHGGVAVGVVG